MGDDLEQALKGKTLADIIHTLPCGHPIQVEIDRLKAELEEAKCICKELQTELGIEIASNELLRDRLAETTERLQANAAKIDDEDVVIAWTDYLKLKAEARQEAAREILRIISIETIDRQFEQSQAAEIIRQRFGLEG